MIPYREASQEVQTQTERPLRAGATAASLAISGGAGAIASRVLPFLSQYIPEAIAIKGLSKIDPRFGSFINKAMSAGSTFDEVKEFIKDKMQPPKEEVEENNQPQQLNELGQFSPELQTFIEQQIQSGKAPDHAAALAMSEASFLDLVNGIEKKVKVPFTKFVRELYEGKAVQSKAALQPDQPQGQSGSGQQALMAILQKIQQSRGQQ